MCLQSTCAYLYRLIMAHTEFLLLLFLLELTEPNTPIRRKCYHHREMDIRDGLSTQEHWPQEELFHTFVHCVYGCVCTCHLQCVYSCPLQWEFSTGTKDRVCASSNSKLQAYVQPAHCPLPVHWFPCKASLGDWRVSLYSSKSPICLLSLAWAWNSPPPSAVTGCGCRQDSQESGSRNRLLIALWGTFPDSEQHGHLYSWKRYLQVTLHTLSC